MTSQKFFRCKHCGNFIGLINNAGVPLKCCGENMEELVANTTEASHEKHLPVVTVEGDAISVNVGSVNHPMDEPHYIAFIYIETENGGQRKTQHPGSPAQATFKLVDDKAIAAYAYCNLHGLWKTNIE